MISYQLKGVNLHSFYFHLGWSEFRHPYKSRVKPDEYLNTKAKNNNKKENAKCSSV